MIGKDFELLVNDLQVQGLVNTSAMNGLVMFMNSLETMRFKESFYDDHVTDHQGNPHMVRGSQILAEENGDYVFGNYHFYYDAANDQITLQLATSAMVEISESDIKMNPYGYDSDFRVSGINSDYIFGDATLEKLLVGNSLDYVPLGTLHVHSGSAGAISVGVNNDDFIIENSASVGMTLASPSTDAGFIVFTDESAGSGKIAYDHTTDYMTFYTNLNIAFALLSNKNAHFYGNVGINTASPSAKLHIFSGSSGSSVLGGSADELLIENSANAGITIRTPDANAGWIMFTDTVANSGYIYYDHSANAMGFATAGTAVLSFLSNQVSYFQGNVGILTASPDGTLHVHTASAGTVTANASADELVLENSGNAGLSILTPNTAVGYILFGDPDLNAVGQIAYNHNNNQMLFYTAGNSALQLLSNQNAFFVGSVGIKTASPDGSLHVFSGSAGTVTANANGDDLVIENSATGGLTILTPNTAEGIIYWGDPEDNDVAYITYEHAANAMGFVVNATNVGFQILPGLTVVNPTSADIDFRVSSDNQIYMLHVDAGLDRIGIKTNTPDGTLHVFTASAGTVTANTAGDDLVIENSTSAGLSILTPNTAVGYILFGDPDNNAYGQITYSHAADAMGFVVGGTQKFSVDSNGYGYIERMYFGTNDTTVGQLVCYGDSADTGGRIFLFNSANNDTVFEYYLIRNVYDDLYIESGDNKVRHILRGTDYSQEFFTGSAAGGTLAMTIGASQGLVIGSATGGDKGAGTINVSSNIYKNNTAYTNPDFVLEHWATGQIEKYKNRERASLYVPMTIYEIEDYARKNWRLPGITDEPAGVFDMTDIALELLERLYIVTIDQQHTIDGLESKLSELERRL